MSILRRGRLLRVCCMAVITLLPACSITQSSPPAPPPTILEVPVTKSQAIAGLVKIIEPTLVRVVATGAEFTMWGSGFIVDERGYVVTNQHLVNQSSQIAVTVMDGDTFTASMVASDARRDVAVLKIASNRTDFPSAVIGSSAGIKVGEEVMCAGFPLGSELPGPATFSVGIVSALRKLKGVNFIQTDIITINVGSSGSPLTTMDGTVVGITVAGVLPSSVDAEGIGLVIPIDEARSFIEKAVSK